MFPFSIFLLQLITPKQIFQFYHLLPAPDQILGNTKIKFIIKKNNSISYFILTSLLFIVHTYSKYNNKYLSNRRSIHKLFTFWIIGLKPLLDSKIQYGTWWHIYSLYPIIGLIFDSYFHTLETHLPFEYLLDYLTFHWLPSPTVQGQEQASFLWTWQDLVRDGNWT